MGKAAENKEKKRKALLNAAFELFTDKGFSQTSISEIVKKAGMAKGTFYLYYQDKEDLRNHLISSISSQIFQNALLAAEQIPVHHFEDRLIAVIDHILDSYERDHTLLIFISKHLSWGIFKNALTADPTPEEVSAYSLYTEFIQTSGYRFKDKELMIYMIIELISGVSYNTILFQQPRSLEEIKPYLYDTVKNIIRQFLIQPSPLS